jgi:hypothetical protein
MDFTNAKGRRMRLDYEYERPLTIEDYIVILDGLYKEQYFVPPGDYYAIKQVNNILVQSTPRRSSDIVDITIWMNVDLAGKME